MKNLAAITFKKKSQKGAMVTFPRRAPHKRSGSDGDDPDENIALVLSEEVLQFSLEPLAKLTVRPIFRRFCRK